MGILEAIEQNNLSYQLTSISLRDIIYLRTAPCDIYGYIGGQFEILIPQNGPLDRLHLNKIIGKGSTQIFVKSHEILYIQKLNREKLLKRTRSLSVGDIQQNLKTEINLLLIQLGQLYEHPNQDDLLMAQYQSLKNIFQVLAERNHFIQQLFHYTAKQKHHYTILHPILSSLFLLGLLQNFPMVHNKEKEALFITNYFKDIGMASIPHELYDKRKLSDKEKLILIEHPAHSREILESRIPLGPAYLGIIENHHISSQLINTSIIADIKSIENIFIFIVDTFCAMISNRPYRKEQPTFLALQYIKNLMEKEYYPEFKILVQFVMNFLKQ